MVRGATATSGAGVECLIELDRELAVAARGAGALRLHLGEALLALAERGGHHELGFSSVAAYALERAQQSGRWAADSAAVARRLGALPRLRAALVTGALGWSMVELVSRHATPASEERLLLRASECTVRQMRTELAAEGARAEPAEEGRDEERCVLTLTLDRWELWLLECTRWLVRTMEPGANWDTVFEGLLAEGSGTLRELLPGSTSGEPQSDTESLRRLSEAWARQCAAWREQAETRSEPRLATLAEGAPSFRPVTFSVGQSASPAELDACIQRLSRELAERDLLLGMLAERFLRADGWRRLGYATDRQYARERLGMSLASMKAKRHLAARCLLLPQVAEALERACLGFEGALLVTRIATAGTVGAWIERAGRRTVKQLREEVDVAELSVRLSSVREQLPPDEEAVRQFAAARRQTSELLAALASGPGVASTRTESASQMSGAESELAPRRLAPSLHGPAGSQVGFGRVTLRFEVTRATRDFWHDFRRVFHRAEPRLPRATTLLSFLTSSFWQVWGHLVVPDVAYAHIYARDGFRCTNPVCTRRDVTPHHLKYRAAGGGDDDENLTSLCVWCHLHGVHDGRLRADPPASHIRWVLGRTPLLIVEGRTKRAA